MITVGYGDITPLTVTEKLYVIFVTLIACGVFAYSINSIGFIIQDMTKRNNEFRQRMALLSAHMKKRGLNNQLQLKVKKYFEYLLEEKLEDNESGDNLLNSLTSSLRNEVLTDIYSKILLQKKIFSLNFSNKFLIALAPKLKEKRLYPEEIIFEQNDPQRNIYFLMSGNVELFINIREHLKNDKRPFKVIQTLSEGDIFGELAFFTGRNSDMGSISLNVVSLVCLNFDDFMEIIRDFPQDYQKFCMLRDNILIYNSTRGLEVQCSSCKNFKHTFSSCPDITLRI